jgi:dihydrofolate reductase
VLIAGGADVAQQYLTAELVDEVQVHVAPVLLGSGVRLFDHLGDDVKLEPDRVIESPHVTHLRYRVVKG